MTTSAVERQPLARVLANRRWEYRRAPYPHVIARKVFEPGVYAEIVQAFEEYSATDGVLRYTEDHDFVGGPLTAAAPEPLHVFLSDEWQQVFARVFHQDLIPHISAGIHRHRPGSRSGFVHNDIKVETSADGVECVRAIAVLFYLNSPQWRLGDGGSTGIYRHWSDPVDAPLSVVTPLDNSLFAFACSPFSYHSFLSNRLSRDSIVLFLYRSLAGFEAQWSHEGVSQYADG
jgi:hypothetical protein